MSTLFQTFLYETFRKSVILGNLEGAGTPMVTMDTNNFGVTCSILHGKMG